MTAGADPGAHGEGRFKRRLGLADLTFIGLGAIFGSGWLVQFAILCAFFGLNPGAQDQDRTS